MVRFFQRPFIVAPPLPAPKQDMEALVGEVGRSHADVALELEGRKQREVSVLCFVQYSLGCCVLHGLDAEDAAGGKWVAGCGASSQGSSTGGKRDEAC